MLKTAIIFGGVAVVWTALLFTPLIGFPAIHISSGGGVFGMATTGQLIALMSAIGTALIATILFAALGMRKLYRTLRA